MLRGALLGLLGLLCSGCAALDRWTADEVVDTERVSAIERAARSQGNQVIWLRYPTKPADETRKSP